MSDNDCFAGQLAAEELKAGVRAPFQIVEILFVRETIVVSMVAVLDLVDDADDLCIVAMPPDDFGRISAFDEKR